MGAALTYRYKDEMASVTCEEGHGVLKSGLPPGVLAGRDDEELPRVFERYVRCQFERTKSRFCSNCSGPTTPQVSESGMWDHVTVKFACERCGQTLHSDVAASLLDYPDTIAFARTHGVDVRETAIWELPLVTNDETTVTAEPFRVRVTYPLDSDELTFVDVSEESDRYDT